MNLVVVATLGTKGYIMACSANHSKGSGSAVGAGLIIGQPGWLQRKINLRPQHRGVHLVTEEILRQVRCDLRTKEIRKRTMKVLKVSLDLIATIFTFLSPHLFIFSLISASWAGSVFCRTNAHPAPPYICQPSHKWKLGSRRSRRHGNDAQQNSARGCAIQAFLWRTRRYGE